MVIKSKYLLMQESIVTDEYGNNYPDLATFTINEFTPTSKAIDYQLTFNDCLRFFDLINTFYQEFTFYDDIILWLNDIEYISDTDENFEKYIKLYKKIDLSRYVVSSLTK